MRKRYSYLLGALSLSLLIGCSDKDDNDDVEGDNGNSDIELTTLTLIPRVSEFLPGRYFFNDHVIDVQGDYDDIRKRLTITDSSNNQIVHQQTIDGLDSYFRQADLDPGNYTVKLAVDGTRDGQLQPLGIINQALLDSVSVNLSSDDNNRFGTIVDETIGVDDYEEIALDSTKDCVVDEQCLANIDGLCALPDGNPVVISCELSASCMSIELAALQQDINQGLDNVDCGRTIYVDDETPIVLWAIGASGVGGDDDIFTDGGSGGDAGQAAMIVTVSDLNTHYATNNLNYALGDDGSNWPDAGTGYGLGGAPTVIGTSEHIYPGDVLLVAGGAGGGEDAGSFEDGDHGHGGGVALSDTTSEEKVGQGDGGSRGGGAPQDDGSDCLVFINCGGSGGGGDGMAGVGGRAGDSDYHNQWINISDDDSDIAQTFAYNLLRSEGTGGDAIDSEFGADSDGGGGGGYGGGGAGDGGDGGGAGAGSYGAPSTILPDFIDLTALEAEMNEHVYGKGTVFLLWAPEKVTE